MTILYYKNPQSNNNFSQLSYQDFGAAAAFHMHSAKDIEILDAHTDEVIHQVLPTWQGGSGIIYNTSIAGIYAGNHKDYKIEKIGIDKNLGVFGYYNQQYNYPSFQIWPVTAGGTGCNNQLDTIKQFGIGAKETIEGINLNNQHIMDAHLTNTDNGVEIQFSIHLPFQLLPNTQGILSLYPLLANQTSNTITTGGSCPTSNFLYGFNAFFSTDQPSLNENCIYEYGFIDNSSDTNNGEAGRVDESDQASKGSVIIYAYSGGPHFNDNQELEYYQDSSIITVHMILAETPNSNFKNNSVLLLLLDKGWKRLKNQLLITKVGL